MKASEIVMQLWACLPNYTDLFTSTVGVVSIFRSGDVATVNCSEVHDLEVGDAVYIYGAEDIVDIVSVARYNGLDSQALYTVDISHDLTYDITGQEVTISSVVDSGFNGTYELVGVPDRTSFILKTLTTFPATPSSGGFAHGTENYRKRYDGIYSVAAAPDDDTFTFNLNYPGAGMKNPIVSGAEVRAKPRITAVATAERIVDVYTKQNTNDLWAFVILGDVAAAKGRNVDVDGTDRIPKGVQYRQQVTQPFGVYVVVPSSSQIAARGARDICEDLTRDLFRSLLGHKFDSGFNIGSSQGGVNFVEHGTFAYSQSYYIHLYSFEQVSDLSFEDTVGLDAHVAFRDIELSMFPTVGTMVESIDAVVDLDET